jgi:hypothetical protein
MTRCQRVANFQPLWQWVRASSLGSGVVRAQARDSKRIIRRESTTRMQVEAGRGGAERSGRDGWWCAGSTNRPTIDCPPHRPENAFHRSRIVETSPGQQLVYINLDDLPPASWPWRFVRREKRTVKQAVATTVLRGCVGRRTRSSQLRGVCQTKPAQKSTVRGAEVPAEAGAVKPP